MVRRSTKPSPAIAVAVGIIAVAALTFGGIYLVNYFINLSQETTNPEPEVVVEPAPEPEPEPEPIDYQQIVDIWNANISGDAGVLIYDMNADEVVAAQRADEGFYTASLYKLFVVYEGYRRVYNGSDNGSAIITGGYTRLKCLDLAIRESYSPCAETIWAGIGHAELDSIVKTDYGITDSNISGLISTPRDIMKIMKRFYDHPDFSDELWEKAADSFLNQPVTTYDWRRGLPSGFSNVAKVYNKVGWDWNPNRNYWNIYDDAAIVDFPDYDTKLIVVVMSNRVDNKDIAKLGTMIEQAVINR